MRYEGKDKKKRKKNIVLVQFTHHFQLLFVFFKHFNMYVYV